MHGRDRAVVVDSGRLDTNSTVNARIVETETGRRQHHRAAGEYKQLPKKTEVEVTVVVVVST